MTGSDRVGADVDRSQDGGDMSKTTRPDTGVPTLAECAAKAATLIDAIKGVRPSGSQCMQCQHSDSDCSSLDFASMRPAGKPDADGVQRVACIRYARAVRPCRCGPDGCSDSGCAGKGGR